jgi:cell division septation protein DedD
MNKNIVRGLVVLGVIILGVVLWLVFRAGPPTVHKAPVASSKPAVMPPAAPPAPPGTPTATPGQPAAGPGGAPITQAKPTEPKITIPPAPARGKKYGVLVRNYRHYPPAARMLKRLKKWKIPGFVQRDPEDTSRFQVWMGPFSSQDEAQAAIKTLKSKLRARHRKRLEIEEIENPVPK